MKEFFASAVESTRRITPAAARTRSLHLISEAHSLVVALVRPVRLAGTPHSHILRPLVLPNTTRSAGYLYHKNIKKNYLYHKNIAWLHLYKDSPELRVIFLPSLPRNYNFIRVDSEEVCSSDTSPQVQQEAAMRPLVTPVWKGHVCFMSSPGTHCERKEGHTKKNTHWNHDA